MLSDIANKIVNAEESGEYKKEDIVTIEKIYLAGKNRKIDIYIPADAQAEITDTKDKNRKVELIKMYKQLKEDNKFVPVHSPILGHNFILSSVRIYSRNGVTVREELKKLDFAWKDICHLFAFYREQLDVFLTIDYKSILNKEAILQEKFQIKALSPSECHKYLSDKGIL